MRSLIRNSFIKKNNFDKFSLAVKLKIQFKPINSFHNKKLQMARAIKQACVDTRGNIIYTTVDKENTVIATMKPD